MKTDTELLDYLESLSLTIYTSDDPEPEKVPKTFTLVDESVSPRRGYVGDTLRETIEQAMGAIK